MTRGALRRRLASSKATGNASSPRAMLGGCSTAKFAERDVVLGEQDGLYAGQKRLLNCAIHACFTAK